MKRFLSMLLLAAMVFTLFCGAAFADDAPAEEAPARTSDVVILFTSDIHCGIDQGFGYAGPPRATTSSSSTTATTSRASRSAR